MLRSSFFVVVIVIAIAITLASLEDESWKPVYIQPEQLHISLGGK